MYFCTLIIYDEIKNGIWKWKENCWNILFKEANLERNEEEKGTKVVNKQLWQCYMYELHNEIDDGVNERGCI